MEGFLLFTSFNQGGHSNVFCKSAEEALIVIEASLDEDCVNGFKKEEDDILDAINDLTDVNDDFWWEASDSTWFTITKTHIDCN